MKTLRSPKFERFSSIHVNNEILIHPKDIANAFASFGSSISSDESFDPSICLSKHYSLIRFSTIQDAFLPHHGVHTLCHSLECTLRENISSRKHSVVISADLGKAFDPVVFTSILTELHNWGIQYNTSHCINTIFFYHFDV